MKNNTEIYLEQYKDIYDNKIILNDKIVINNTLDSFYNEIKSCTKCSLSKSRTNLVFGTGNPSSLDTGESFVFLSYTKVLVEKMGEGKAGSGKEIELGSIGVTAVTFLFIY